MQQFLNDTKNGKKIEWKEHKTKSLELADVYKRLGLANKQLRLQECCNFLEFRVYENCEKKLQVASFCKVRLCPMCAWRRSLKIFGQVSKVMNYITEEEDYRYVFITLTVRNVPGDKLSSEIDLLFKAFNLLTKRKEFKAISKGWFRCLEVTHNWDTNEYHPHFHIVMAVNKSYFKEKKLYLSHARWVQLWKECAGLDYEPMVNVKTVKPNADGSYGKAVAEVAKYAAKVSDYLHENPEGGEEDPVQQMLDEDGNAISWTSMVNKKTDEAVLCLDIALHRRRLATFGGLFREVHKMLNLDDAESGDLVNTDNEEEFREDLNYILMTYNWNVGYKDYTFYQKKEQFNIF